MNIDDNRMVSVIIPVFNAERYLAETLDSVISQDYLEKEIIIVDDCSTDSSIDIIRQYQQKVSYITYYKMNVNSGVALARNKGIQLAKGRYIAFVDSDDVWKNNKLVRQLELFNLHSGCPFTYTAIDYINESSKIIKGKRSLRESVTFNYLLRNTIIATSTVIVDRNVVPEIIMPNRRSAEDYSLWLSLLKEYGPAYGINDVLTSYRISSTSISSNRKKEVKYFYAVQTEDIGINKIYAAFNTLCYIFNAVKKHYF